MKTKQFLYFCSYLNNLTLVQDSGSTYYKYDEKWNNNSNFIPK